MMKVTVGMCTYNPTMGILLKALDAIVAQLGDVPSAEIIVIDNNSCPPLAGCQDLSAYPIRLIAEPKAGLTAAREAVVNNAQGDVVVFVDDDNILGEHYLKTVVNEFSADPQLGLLGGCIIPQYETPPPKWFTEFEPWLAIRRYPPELHIEVTELPTTEVQCTKYFPVGAGFATTRDLALSYQHDCAETMRIEGRHGKVLSSGEDMDFGFFLLHCGSKLVVTGALSLTHVIPAGRVRSRYLKRLAVGNVKSSFELEQKWAPRFGRSVYPMFSMSLASLLARSAATMVIGACFHRYRIKRCVYMALARVRIGTAIKSTGLKRTQSRTARP
jgi:glycosyltransferase involved in cell wall biosynthesis